jgi:hypothetical protein
VAENAKRAPKVRAFFRVIFTHLGDIGGIVIAVVIVAKSVQHHLAPEDIPNLIAWQIGAFALVILNRFIEAAPISAVASDIRDLSKVVAELQVPSYAAAFLSLHDPLTDTDFDGAEDIWLVGITLSRTLGTYGTHLRERVRAGANIRILTVDDEDPDILSEYDKRYINEDAKPGTGRQLLSARLQNANTAIDVIRGAVTENARGSLVVGKMKLYPPYGLRIFNPGQPMGRCYGEMYHHKEYGRQAHFTLHPTDKDWYSFFIDQFKAMWKTAETKKRLVGPAVTGEDL